GVRSDLCLCPRDGDLIPVEIQIERLSHTDGLLLHSGLARFFQGREECALVAGHRVLLAEYCRVHAANLSARFRPSILGGGRSRPIQRSGDHRKEFVEIERLTDSDGPDAARGLVQRSRRIGCKYDRGWDLYPSLLQL